MWRVVLNANSSGLEAPLPTAEHALEALRGGPDEAASEAVDGLARVELKALKTGPERLTFWLNAYNALFLHARRRLRPTGSVVTNLLLFERPAWWVGGHLVSLNDVEHGVLRRNQRGWPFVWRRRFSPGDARAGLLAERLEPRIHFALNCGAVSCPPIRVYRPDALDAQLDLATRGFLTAATRVDRGRNEVTLSALLKLYARDFGSRVEAVRFTARHLDGAEGAWLLEHAAAVRVRFGHYDWTLTRA
ncbi:MAG: DUF547 domain-containing protein [Myxococcaceae bacterium]|nr:DUF547 domain-containing protein [Myxococcaceae bacterium]